MQLFRWVAGRQNSGYYKMLLIASKIFKFDMYLLKFPAGVGVPEHRDPSVFGYEHHRINIVLYGDVNKLVVSRKSVATRIQHLRPDIETHSLGPVQKTTVMLSIGWLKKIRPDGGTR